MSNLSVEAYNNLEKEFLQKNPVNLIRDFYPNNFLKMNIQSRIESKSELWKFIDTMHENSYEYNLELLGGLSNEEFKIFERLILKTIDYSKKLNDEQICSGKNAISKSLIPVRAIKKILNKNAQILDFGSGSGFVSLSLYYSGFKVISYDVTQALFLHQNNLFNSFLNNDYNLITDKNDYYKIDKYNFCHMPWWVFSDYENLKLSNLDCITLNHTLNEISPNTILYLNSFIEKNILNFEIKDLYLVIENLGANVWNNFWFLRTLGYKLIHEPLEGYEKVYVFKKEKFTSLKKFKYPKPNVKKINIFLSLRRKILSFAVLIRNMFINKKYYKRKLHVLKSGNNFDLDINSVKDLLQKNFKEVEEKTKNEKYNEFLGKT
tara:strand:- start:19 stop:1149 length:1131 start_codon:yes stop_codon:yes gene_type:complete